MKIPHKIKYFTTKLEELDFYKFIQTYCTCEYGCSLSEYFQVLSDTNDIALYRLNNAIDINNGWVGVLVTIDLKNNIIGFGNDWAIKDKGFSHDLYDMKTNGIIQNTYPILKVIY